MQLREFSHSEHTMWPVLLMFLWYMSFNEIHALMWTPASRVRVLWLQQTNSHKLQKSCGEKGWQGRSLRERGPEDPDPCLVRLLLLFWVHYVKVCCRWLPFTDNKGKNVANYVKEKDVTDLGEKWLNWLHTILGRFSLDFRKLKILPQSRVREFYQKQVS